MQPVWVLNIDEMFDVTKYLLLNQVNAIGIWKYSHTPVFHIDMYQARIVTSC